MGLKQPFVGYGAGMNAATTTFYWAPFLSEIYCDLTSTGQAKILIDQNITVRNWKIELTAAPGSGISRIFTLVKNDVDTTLVVTITGTDTIGSDIVHNISVSAGDILHVKQTTSGGTPAASDFDDIIEVETADNNTSLGTIGQTQSSTLNGTGTYYSSLLYGGLWTTNAGFTDSLIATPGDVTSYRVRLSAAPGSGKSRTLVIEKNGVAQDGTGGTPNTTIIISDTATSGSATFTLSVVAGDLVRVKQTPSGSPTVTGILGSSTFVSTTVSKCNFGMSTDDTYVGSNNIEFANPFGASYPYFATESLRDSITPVTPFELDGFIISLTATPPSTFTVTLRKNGADTVQAHTITNPATSAGPSAAATISVGTSDVISIKVVGPSAGHTGRLRAALVLSPVSSGKGSRGGGGGNKGGGGGGHVLVPDGALLLNIGNSGVSL